MKQNFKRFHINSLFQERDFNLNRESKAGYLSFLVSVQLLQHSNSNTETEQFFFHLYCVVIHPTSLNQQPYLSHFHHIPSSHD